MTDDIHLAAARLIGMKVDEIADVSNTDDGVVITTTDGVSLIDVPADAPDADGKTGLMLLRLPKPANDDGTPRTAAHYTMPVFTPHPVDDAGDELVDPDAVPDGSIKAVLEWVGDDVDRAQQAYDAECAAEKPRASLVAKLDEQIDAAAAALAAANDGNS